MNNWQDLVPFYVAGQLAPQERAAFEAFMMRSPECQQAVAEWQNIAREVWEEVHTRSNHLPPLSQSLRSQLNVQPSVMRNGRDAALLEETVIAYHAPRVEYAQPMRPSTPPKKRGNPRIFAFAGVAAALMFVCAGVIFFALQNSSTNDDNTDSPEVASRPKDTETPLGTPQPTTTLINATSTTVPIVVATDSTTILPTPTQLPVNSGGGVGSAGVTSITETPLPPPVFSYLASPTAFPSEAPVDQAQYDISVDSFAVTTFNEIISFPIGDLSDVLALTVKGSEARDLQIAVYCFGENTDAMRWHWAGNIENPFRCGETQILALANGTSGTLTLTFDEGSTPSITAYTVSITPKLPGGGALPTPTSLPVEIAPQDIDPHNFGVQIYTAQKFTEALSMPMPLGDSADNINLTLYWAESDSIRYEFNLLMTCTGSNTSALQWTVGNSDTRYYCGHEVPEVFLSTADSTKLISVFLEDNGDANYVEYTLIANPQPIEPTPAPDGSNAAPADAEPHDFVVTRSTSNKLTDRISYPTGDTLDRIHLTVADMQPGEARELEISLTCTGTGTENVIWTTLVGQKSNLCGGVLYATLTSDNNRMSFDVTVNAGFSSDTNVTYTLEVREVQ